MQLTALCRRPARQSSCERVGLDEDTLSPRYRLKDVSAPMCSFPRAAVEPT